MAWEKHWAKIEVCRRRAGRGTKFISYRYVLFGLGCMLAFLVLALFTVDTLYDVVIANGRVMDPERRPDGVRTVGAPGGKIQATSPLNSRTNIDAKGLVVPPGLIDLHEHR